MPWLLHQGKRHAAVRVISRFDSRHNPSLLLRERKHTDDAAIGPTATEERSFMHSQTIRYARNGALGAIALYLVIALPLLAVSMQHRAQPVPTESEATAAAPNQGSFT